MFGNVMTDSHNNRCITHVISTYYSRFCKCAHPSWMSCPGLIDCFSTALEEASKAELSRRQSLTLITP